MFLRYLFIGVTLCLLTFKMVSAADPKIPEGVEPLDNAAILKLLDGRKFEFAAYDEPITGTTLWEFDKGTVSGSYIQDNTNSGTYSLKWFVKDGKSCTLQGNDKTVCQSIYPYENGFMEVNSKGKVHTISLPAN